MTKRLHLVHETTDANPKRVDGSDHVDTPAALGGCSGQPVNHRTHTGSRPVGQASHPHNQRHANTRARGSTKDDSVSAESSKVFNVSDDAVTPVEHSPENGPFDARRDTAAGAFPSSLGVGGLPNPDDQSHGADRWLAIIAGGGACWAAFIGVLVGVWTVDVLFAALAMYSIGIALVAAGVIADRASIDILGDRQAKQERLACHLLHQSTGNVQASPISRPIPKCAKCREPVFLSGLCAAHFQQYIDLAHDYSWEQSHDF